MVPPPPALDTPPLPLSDADLTFWRSEIERSEKLRTDTIAAWDVKGNLERYTPRSVVTETGAPDLRVNVAKDFSDVERKKAALFYDTPTISLIPDAGTPPPPLLLFQELLNQLLGPKRMRCKHMAMATIQDCLVAIQPCPTEIGYTAVTELVTPPPVMTPLSPVEVAAGIPPEPMPQPPMPVTVWEDIFWTRISPAAILLPVLLRDTRYDDAPWIGYRWRKPVSQVRREYKLPDDVALADNTTEKPYFEPLAANEPDTGEPMCAGVKLWYRASLRDASVSHPLVIRELVLIDGMDQPVVHKGLACQTIGPDGRLTPDSMIGYPLHPLALRNLTDSPYVAADCTLTSPLTRELNKYRTQIIQRRDGSKLHMLIDAAKVNEDVRQKIGQGNEPTMIPVEPGTLDGGADRIMAQVPAITLGRESYTGQDIIERDRAQILGIDANQVGTGGGGSRTATEVSNVQRNADARFEQERQTTLEWWLAGVQKVAALVLRYGDRIAIDLLGAARGQQWIQAKQQGLFQSFSYEIVIDSGNYVDIEAKKRTDLNLYNLTAQDPSTHHEEILVRLATDFGIDPSKWIVTQKPEPKPEPPKLSITVKPEDLDPALPSYVGTHAMLTAAGVVGLPPPLSMAQQQQGPPPPGPPAPAPPGMAEKAPRLDQHQMDATGQRSGPPPVGQAPPVVPGT
jgi:hypothetical protein